MIKTTMDERIANRRSVLLELLRFAKEDNIDLEALRKKYKLSTVDMVELYRIYRDSTYKGCFSDYLTMLKRHYDKVSAANANHCEYMVTEYNESVNKGVLDAKANG